MEQGSGKLGVLGLLDLLMLNAILGIGIVSVLPFILPTLVVVISISPGNLVSDGDVNQGGGSEGSEAEGVIEDDLLRGSLLGLEGSLGES